MPIATSASDVTLTRSSKRITCIYIRIQYEAFVINFGVKWYHFFTIHMKLVKLLQNISSFTDTMNTECRRFWQSFWQNPTLIYQIRFFHSLIECSINEIRYCIAKRIESLHSHCAYLTKHSAREGLFWVNPYHFHSIQSHQYAITQSIE